MNGVRPLKRLLGGGAVEDATVLTSVRGMSTEAVGINPTGDLIAKVTLALAEDQTADGNLVVTLGRGHKRWSLRKSASLLFVGCGLFWLIAYMTVTALV
jgi:hypothetical protein